MLFLVNANGVPSVAPFVSLSSIGTFRDVSVADFSAGSPDANIFVAQSGPEIVLRPSLAQDFNGSALPAGWSTTPWQTGGGSTMGGGFLLVDGARTGTDALRGFGSLEFVATFGVDRFRHVGLGLTLNETPYALFSTETSNVLWARTHNGTTATDTLIPGEWLDAPHIFRIDWSATAVTFSIDDNVVASHAVAIPGNLRPLASDFTVGSGALTVDWLRMSPYPTSGTFLSRIFDGGGTTNWGPLWWDGYTPPGTTLTLSVRRGNTPVPDGTWSAFTTVPTSGNAISGSSRYLQYRAVLTTNNPNETPYLWEVAIGHSMP
jgi:hypothetical protein